MVDYGIGNLRSVERALLHAGAVVLMTRDPAAIAAADGVVLPGVGAFGAALDALDHHGLRASVLGAAASGRPLLGVCLGYQLLFDWSDESGGRAGLGLLPGRVLRLGPERGKVPHMGWNQLRILARSRLLHDVADGAHVYFVHAYAATSVPVAALVAETDYGGPIAAVAESGNVAGTQFHPEKSGADGLRVYANFARACDPSGGSGAQGPLRA